MQNNNGGNKAIREYLRLSSYLFFSLVVTLIEMVIGWLLLQCMEDRILIVNTIALTIGAVIHYLLTTRFSFRKPYTLSSIGVYAASHVLGLIIQNAIIFALYHHLLDGLSEGLQYVLSKILSMLAALIITYFIRAKAHGH